MNDVVDHWAKEAGISVSILCDRTGMSRQNYYAARRHRQCRQIDEDLVVELVKAERKIQPRIGGRKLLYLIQSDMVKAGVSIGRDRFFELLKSNDLLVERKRIWPRTTNSRHSLAVDCPSV